MHFSRRLLGRRLAAFACTVIALMSWGDGVMAQDVQVGKLVIETPWSRATPGGAKLGVGYLAIVNIGDKSDKLLAASTPIADRVEIHSTQMQGGVMRMRQIEGGLLLKAQEVTELKPGGIHLMFIGLKRPIKKGAQLPVQLTFEVAGKVDLSFAAAGIGARQAPSNPDLEKAKGSRSGATSGGNGGSRAGSGAGKGSH